MCQVFPHPDRPMIINETLARGLKGRFFYDFSTEISGAFHKELRSMSLRSIKRGKWVKAARACVDRLERFSIASYEGGSKVKPYFVTTVLEVLDSREYNTWNEKCLYSQQLLLAFDPPYVDCRWGNFNIGEHAIVRLFMRSPVQEDAQGNLLPYSIVKQLRYVPFWSTFWIWFHAMTRDIDFRGLLSIVIPAPDGVFVAHMSKTENAVEIRTFIDSKSLNTDRKAVRDLMIQVSEPLLESPLSASPAVEFANLDYGNAFLTPVLCRKLAPHSDLLASCLFRQADHGDQGTPVREARQLFQQQLSLLAGKADPYWEMFENAPLREFLTQANHFVRQSHTTTSARAK
jgi:hypothetical protein